MRSVVDASVAVKWYFPEAGASAADAVLERALEGSAELLAPDLIVPEFVNVLWKKVRLDECSSADATQVLELWHVDRPRLVESAGLAERALELALRLAHPVYDCLYVAAAIENQASLVTADRSLARAALTVLPDVELVC